MPAPEPSTRLMLLLPADISPESASALAGAGNIAAVIAEAPDGPQANARLSALAGPVQAAGAAFLIDGRADLAEALDLDGAHLAGLPALRAALPALKPRRIAGAGGLASRHDAMEAGEAGADYVLFGDLEGPFERIVDAVEWWAELFEIPCVGIAGSEDEALALARAGADFIALSGPMLEAGAIRRLDAILRGLEACP